LEAWLGLVGALGGVIISGILERVRLSSQIQLEKQRQYDQERRKKLEELFEVICEIRFGYGKSYINALQRVECSQNEPNQAGLPVSRLKMLVNFYAPEASEALESFNNAREKYSSALGDTIGSEKLPKSDREKIHARLNATCAAVESSCDKLSEKVVQIASSLTPRTASFRHFLVNRDSNMKPRKTNRQ
jgi:hypothetical protein